jgi:isopentenyl phosphate kinase
MRPASARSPSRPPPASSSFVRRATAANADAPTAHPRLACLVKLGGALITDKLKDETLRAHALRETARHLAIAYRESSASGSGGAGLVVVHGAGSYGHFPARKYGIARGGDLRTDPTLRQGLCVTRLRVSKLHALVLEALVEAGVPATGLPPFAAPWGPTGGPGVVAPHRSAAACDRIADCLSAGLVPVLYGDCVLDDRQGCAILSGDVLMREVAGALRPQRAVFLTDVDGVFDRPPEEPGARVGVGGGVLLLRCVWAGRGRERRT